VRDIGTPESILAWNTNEGMIFRIDGIGFRSIPYQNRD
jgi:hypothetical protein